MPFHEILSRDRKAWDFRGVPPEKYPLLLHFHPLVIYRHQVIKQADVVLATVLLGEQFTLEEKERIFECYDPLTTGDSSLSSCVQAIVAAEVGYDELALEYFTRSLHLDLCDSHGNTSDGVHVANAGGIWAAVVHGFAGMVEQGNHIEFSPRLPRSWDGLSFRLLRHGSSMRIDVDPDGLTVTVLTGSGVPVRTGDDVTLVTADEPLRIER